MERKQNMEASDEIETRKNEKMFPLFHSDAKKHTNREKEVKHDEIIKKIEKELKLRHLKEMFICYYGMKRGIKVVRKRQNLFHYWIIR